MTDLAPAGGYAPTESFESGRVTAVSADESRVVLGTENGRVEIVTADGRTTVEFDAAITDLAAGNRVYALVDGTISALSAGGTRVWSVELPEARNLAALPGADVLGVVTNDVLLGFDGETGGQEFEVERPYADVTDDPGFFGTDGAFVLVAWSFLAVRNLDGTERFELNLDGAIESAGIVDDTVVVSLKDERVIGVHATTGERQWERELAVTDLPDRGEDALLFSADDQLVTLSADGTYATVEELPSGDVYPTTEGNLFCAITDGTIGVYCASGNPAESLSVSAVADELVADVTDEVDLEVQNTGNRPVSAALRIDGDGLTLGRPDCSVDLAPGESVTHSFTVESVTADESATAAVEADGEHVGVVSMPVAAASMDSLDAEAKLDAVTDGVAEFAVEMKNEGDAALTDVSVSPGDVRVGRLAPGESATATVETGFDPESAVQIVVQAEETETHLDAVGPDSSPDLAIEATDEGFVDVRVENSTEAHLTDSLAVEGNCLDVRIERRVEIPGRSAFVLAFRPDTLRDAVTVDGTLLGLGIGQSARFDSEHFDAAAGGRTAGNAGQTGATENAGQTEIAENVRQTTDAVGGTSGGADLSAERTVETSEPTRTQGVRERLQVVNEGHEPATGVRVEGAEESIAVGELAPDETVRLERHHVFAETGTATIPTATVTAEDAAEARIPAQKVEVISGDLGAEVTLEPDDEGYRIRATLSNYREVECEVVRIGAKQFGVWTPDDLRIPPGETVEWTHRVDSSGVAAEAVKTAVEYTFDSGEIHPLGTLSRVCESTQAGSEGIDGLVATIGEETRISGGYGSVVVVVENRADAPLADVAVEAAGEAVSDLMYTGRESVGVLEPGDQFTHFVDVETEGPQATISVNLSTDEDEETELTLGGPAPADEDGWSPDALDAWSVERANADDSGESGHVTTEFEQV